jgi:tRNA-dihydrouridine synthase
LILESNVNSAFVPDIDHTFIHPHALAIITQLHGRTRAQRYTRLADWAYVNRCAAVAAAPTATDACDAEQCQRPFRRMPMIGNGDVFHFTDFEQRLDEGGFDAVMIGRFACARV